MSVGIIKSRFGMSIWLTSSGWTINNYSLTISCLPGCLRMLWNHEMFCRPVIQWPVKSTVLYSVTSEKTVLSRSSHTVAHKGSLPALSVWSTRRVVHHWAWVECIYSKLGASCRVHNFVWTKSSPLPKKCWTTELLVQSVFCIVPKLLMDLMVFGREWFWGSARFK